MHNNYKTDEKILRDIIRTNVICTDPINKINLIIYYRNRKANSLVMKNNSSPPPSTMQQSNLVYAFNCPLSHSKATAYIGYTECTLDRRITGHSYNGSIKQHFMSDHNIKPTKELIANNTTILTKAQDKHRLTIKEALLILKHSSAINRQFDNFQHTLKLHKHHTTNEPSMPTQSQTPQPSSQISLQSEAPSAPLLSPSQQPEAPTAPPLSPSLQHEAPSAPPLSPISATLCTPNRLISTNNIGISPNIQNRIDSLL